jgi:ferredoxin
VRTSRRLVLELLASSVDLSTASSPDGSRPTWPSTARPGTARAGNTRLAAGHRRQQPVKVDNDLYVRDYAKCILCYKCVEACGTDAQNTFAIAVAGRGFDARISTELDVPLPDSACVYCGNCIAVCPTGALMFKSEHDMRAAGHVGRVRGRPRPTRSARTAAWGARSPCTCRTTRIVKVTSPHDHEVTHGHLCIRQADPGHRDQPDAGRRGQDHDHRRPGRRAEPHRQEGGDLPARAVARAGTSA